MHRNLAPSALLSLYSLRMASNQNLTEEVLQMIEQNRLKALMRKRKLQEQNLSQLNNDATASKAAKQSANPQSLQHTSSNLTNVPSANHAMLTNYVRKPNENINANFTQIKSYSASSNKQQPTVKTTQMTNSSNVNTKKVIKMSAVLEDANRFCVSCEYEADIIKIFRDVESKRWDPISKKWSFSLCDFYGIFTKIKNLKNLTIQLVDSIPETVINTLIESNKNNNHLPELTERLDSKFVEGLYDFQRKGVIFGIQREGRCLIADDMGLGKTIQAIALAMWYRKDWPLIIVCPSSLRFQWKKCILQWVKDLEEKDIFVVQGIKDILPKVPVTITSYDLLARLKTRFTAGPNRFYNMIIMDESHYIKSDVALRTSTALLIVQSCKRVILLSGTPALSKPIGIFCIFVQ